MVDIQHKSSILGQMSGHLVVFGDHEEVLQQFDEVVWDKLGGVGLSLDDTEVFIFKQIVKLIFG